MVLWLQHNRNLRLKCWLFYTDVVGTIAHRVEGIDVVVMRNGPQVGADDARFLIQHVTAAEIKEALNGIGDLKAPGLDGYNAGFFKSTWGIVGSDVITAVHEFF